MADIFREVDEELRRDRLEQVWKRYGGVIVAVALVVVVGTVGYTGWQRWEERQAREGTAELLAALELADEGDPAAAADALAVFAAEASDEHATVARLYEASLRSEEGDAATAAAIYEAVAEDGGVAEPYRDLATVLAALHAVETAEPDVIRSRLAPLTVPGSPWRFSALELTAVATARAGDRAGAAEILEGLAQDAEAPAGVRARAADLAARFRG